MNPQIIINSYLENKPDNLQVIANAIADHILLWNSDMDVDIKWKRITFALNQDFHHWICAINVTKKNVSLIFHFGGLFNDPNNRLISGKSRLLRKIDYFQLEEINKNDILFFLTQAIDKLPYFMTNWKEYYK